MAKTTDRKTASRAKKTKKATGAAAHSRKSPHAAKSRAVTVTATTADRHPAKKTKTAKAAKTQKVTAASRKPKEKTPEARAAKKEKRNRFSEQYLPYILGAVGLLLGVLMVLNAIGAPRAPGQSHAGWLGYYICYGLFGVLGWTAAAIPVLLIGLAILWRKYKREGILLLNSVLCVVLLVFVSAVIHVCVCAAHPYLADEFMPDYLFHTGAIFQSGGVVGGLLGYLLGYALGLFGTLALALVTLPFIIMCLVGVTPAYVFSRIRQSSRERRERRAVERAERREREDQLTVEREERNAHRRRVKTAPMDDEDDDRDEDIDENADENDEPVTEKAKKKNKKDKRDRRMLTVDPDTGEVVQEDDPTPEPDETQDDAPVAEEQGSTRRTRPTDSTLPFDDDTSVYDTPPEVVEIEPVDEPSYGYIEHTEADDLPPDITDTMEVDFSDDPEELPFEVDAPVRRVGQTGTVRYTVETDNGGDELPDDVPTTTVRILKSDTSAIVEQGLSEEEVVISSATGEEIAPAPEYQFPPIDILARGSSRYEADEAEIAENTRTLRSVLESFRIGIRDISCSCGPTITRFEVKPEAGIRVRSIANLVDDIAMGLAKSGVRIEAPIPGKAAVGIEVPNAHASTVYLRNLIETPEFQNHKSRLAACLGADVSGRPVIMDIYKMPHLLIAGATGMGKSVCINSIIMSLTSSGLAL